MDFASLQHGACTLARAIVLAFTGMNSAMVTMATVAATAALMAMAVTPQASAQSYPAKPVRLIVPYPAGASITAREIANAFSQELGQQFVVDHRPGAAATMGHTLIAKSPPDGYTIGIGTTGGLVSGPALLGNRIPYDPLRDFTHIGLATYIYYALFVNASSPAHTVADFIKLAKASPGKLNYSSPGVGTPNHIGGAQLVTLAGIDLLHVPYKGSGLSLSDLIAGTIHLTITGFSSTMPHIKAGRLRVIGVGHTQRIKFAPEVPAVNETIPGYYNTGWWGLIAPPGLPKTITERLNAIMNKALQSPEVAQRFFAMGNEAATSTPQGYTDLIRSDLQAWRKLIKEAKISVDSLP